MEFGSRSYLEAATVEHWPFSPLKVHTDPLLKFKFSVEEDSCLSRVSFFSRALVGRVGSVACSPPSLEKLKLWVDSHWKSVGGVVVRRLHSSLFCFIFASEHEANMVLQLKSWSVHGAHLFLDKWHPLGCCSKSGGHPKSH